MNQRLDEFAGRLASQGLREIDEAIALVWFLTHLDGQTEGVSPSQVAAQMLRHRLRSSVNTSRLAKNLAANEATVRGTVSGTFRIKASKDSDFSAAFADFLESAPQEIADDLIPNDVPLGGRPYLEAMRLEANGCYQYQFYDGAAVLCRRLLEMLLVEAFEKAGQLAAIQDSVGNIKMLSDVIAAAKTKQFIRLSRTSPAIADKIKAVGDAAAHNRFYITRKRDLDELNPNLRHILTELSALAGL